MRASVCWLVVADVTPAVVQIVIDSTDARASAEFWRQYLDLRYRSGHEPPAAGEDDRAGRDWLNLLRADGRPLLAIQQVEMLPRATWPAHDVPQQMHLDLSVPDLESLNASVRRAKSLGARELYDRRGDDEEPLVVLADPMGHPFCVFVRDGAAPHL